MAENNENKTPFFEKIKKKRQISVIDEHSYEQRWSTQLSILNILTLLGLFTLVIVSITYSTLTYTPLKYLVTGQEDQNYKEQLSNLNHKYDSLLEISVIQTQYYNRMQTLMNGGTFKEDTLYKTKKQTTTEDSSFTLNPSKEDSLFRAQMQESAVPQSFNSTQENIASIQGIFFYSPISGKISRSFSLQKKHLGTDIVGKKGDAVKAAVDGTVIYKGYSLDDGNIVILSHGDNLQSVYKHNEEVLKNVGDKVKAGDPIATVGNTGENTSGYHVHFEIWHNGQAVDPENYISF